MPNWKKVIVSGSNAVLNHITASGHLTALNGGFTVDTAGSTELEVVGDISASGGTVTANDLEVRYRKLDITSNTDYDYDGDVVFFGSNGDNFEQGLVHHYDGAQWDRADYDLLASATGILAIALGDNVNNGMLIRGFFTLNDDYGSAGDPLYLGNNGEYNNTPPTGNGQYSRVLGTILNNTNGQIYFNPSSDWIEIES